MLNSNVTSNNASNVGGGVYLAGGLLLLKGSVIEDNVAAGGHQVFSSIPHAERYKLPPPAGQYIGHADEDGMHAELPLVVERRVPFLCPPNYQCNGTSDRVPCPAAMSSPEGSTSVADCACPTGLYLNLSNASGSDCAPCGRGFDCSSHAATTRTLDVLRGYWRPSGNATSSRRCRLDTCEGGQSSKSFSFLAFVRSAVAHE